MPDRHTLALFVALQGAADPTSEGSGLGSTWLGATQDTLAPHHEDTCTLTKVFYIQYEISQAGVHYIKPQGYKGMS